MIATTARGGSGEFNGTNCSLPKVKIWFQNRRMKWRNSKERELLASGGSRDQTLPNKNNPHPDLSDAQTDPPRVPPTPSPPSTIHAAAMINTEQGGDPHSKSPAPPLLAGNTSWSFEPDEYADSDCASDEEINVT
ncbi:homeobox protein DBX1-like [Ctenocephalides felis]|uniref:homeobox protein DBX1-like n=1 Tax=Ctenocephalides felis TaxID=7515 RepID=UPI000E6E3D2E|nr:homeobox protein DBX1-like [Ctenocephalides felis]